jgi:hypothetical protein
MSITMKQNRAAIEFYNTKSWERAARSAGYKSTSAASELRCNPRVLERVKQLEQNDSLMDYATLSHCTDYLIRAALGQLSEIKVGKESLNVKFGSRIKKYVVLDTNGKVKTTSVTFEHDPLRALELLFKAKGWFGEQPTDKSVENRTKLQHILAAAKKVRDRHVGLNNQDSPNSPV